MKALILSLGLLALSACGSSGGSGPAASSVALPAPLVPGPSCKSLNSVWQSTTNHERHDLTNVPLQNAHTANFDNTTWNAYSFLAGSTGERCPANGQPQTNILVTQIDQQVLAAGFQSLMYLHNLYPSVACSTYQNPGQSTDGTTTGAAYIKLECNQLTMCRTMFPSPAGCTVFN